MRSTPPALRERWHRLRSFPHLRRFVTVGALLLTLGFLVILLLQGRQQLSQFDDWEAYLKVCLQGFLLYPLSLSLQALIWSMMVARLGRMRSRWRDIEIYAYTHLMRRLPGALWYLAGRTVIYRERGIGAGVPLAASGLEWLLLLMAAVLIYAGLSLSNLASWLLGLVILTLVVIVGLWGLRKLRSPHAWRWLPGFARRWLDTLPGIGVPQVKDLVLWLGLYGVAYIIGGLILFLLVRGVTPDCGVTVPSAIRIWALTAGLSYLTLTVLPAGLGIRELTLTALLAPDVPIVAAVLVALLLRVLFIGGDLIWGSLMWAIALVAGRSRQRTSTDGEGPQGDETTCRRPKTAGLGGAESENTTNG